MKVLVAGATGVIGRALIPRLHDEGYDVVGLARRRPREPLAEMTTVDALDADAVWYSVRKISPDVVVNLLTAIPQRMQPRRFPSQMTATNQLRMMGTANLLAAARRARFITESVAFFYRPGGPALADEDRPLWSDGPKPLRSAIRAVEEAERRTRRTNGVVLRVGHLYGPGTHLDVDGYISEQVRSGRFPLVRGREAVFSFVHVVDAASAFAAALASDAAGVFNVTGDEPAPTGEWVPELARLLGGPALKRVPRSIARLAAGSWGLAFMTSLVGADNRRARHVLGWSPSHPSWRAGFAEELSRAERSGTTSESDAAA